MLRNLLFASPLALALVSCADSSPSFDDSHLPGGTESSAGSGTISDPSMNDASGAPSDVAGTSNGGSSNGQAGTPAHGGTASGGKGNQGGGSTGMGGTSSAGSAGTNSGAGTSNGGGGSGNNTGGNAGTSSGAGTSNGGNSAGGTSAGSGGMPGGGMPGGGMPGGGWGGNWGGRGCPDITGSYSIDSADGACNGFNRDAPQSIQDYGFCSVHFVSDSLMGNSAINGNATLDRNGEFSGTVLYFGKNLRSQCSGTWNETDQTMTVACGFQNELCTVVLVRQ